MAELQTDNNRLSIWKIENDQDLLDAFIALGSNCTYIGTMDAVKIKIDAEAELDIVPENGETPTIGINEKHRDICNLNYETLGDVINMIVSGIREDGYIRKTKSEMKKILVDAYEANRLDMDKVNPSMKEAIIKAAKG